MNKRTALLASLALVLSLLAQPALAWGRLGHWLVGELAARKLTPAAREQVEALLQGERDPTLGGIASWADDLRNSDPDRFKATSRWHYINAKGGGCGFELARDCKSGDCAVLAIESQLKIVTDKSRPLEARRDALKFVVHIVGDLHQPMHAGNRTDAGGNGYNISLRTDIEPEAYAAKSYDRATGVMGTNLHSVWDYYILTSAKLSPQQYADKLDDKALARQLKALKPGTALDWACESCELIDAKQLYPLAANGKEEHRLDHAYLDAQRPLAEQRIRTAAVRLAALLNDNLK